MEFEFDPDKFVPLLKEKLKSRTEHVDKVMGFYRDKKLTIGAFSNFLGLDLFHTWLGLVGGIGLKLYSIFPSAFSFSKTLFTCFGRKPSSKAKV